MTFGDLYTDDDLLFGPALIRAHELESKEAIYPRIVVDQCIFEELASGNLRRNAVHDLDEEFDHLESLLVRGTDGLAYIDYLQAYPSADGDELDEYLALLERHRKHILRNLRTVPSSSAAFSKLFWLATRHNQAVSRLEKRNVGERLRKRLLLPVTTKLGPTLFQEKT